MSKAQSKSNTPTAAEIEAFESRAERIVTELSRDHHFAQDVCSILGKAMILILAAAPAEIRERASAEVARQLKRGVTKVGAIVDLERRKLAN